MTLLIFLTARMSVSFGLFDKGKILLEYIDITSSPMMDFHSNHYYLLAKILKTNAMKMKLKGFHIHSKYPVLIKGRRKKKKTRTN